MTIAIPFLDETRLVELVQVHASTRRRWEDQAACRDLAVEDDPYFPDDDATPPTAALACCSTCPVAYECLATALLHEAGDGYRFGWWGGLSPDERERLWQSMDVADPLSAQADLSTPAAIARSLRAQDQTIAQIAAQLRCSERTVYRYLAATAA